MSTWDGSGWIVAATSDEYGRVYLHDYFARDEAGVVRKVMDGARREGSKATIEERLDELNWEIVRIDFREHRPF